MLNHVIVVGRINNDPERLTDERNHKLTTINLVVPRSYKNEKGEYDSDEIEIKLYDAIATTTLEYVRKGDLVGVKGRLQNNDGKIIVIAEKVTFLSSKKEEREE